MKKLLKLLFSKLEDTKKTDSIKLCLDIIFNENNTEQSIYIMKKVRLGFNDELHKRFENNKKENNLIDGYFNPQKRINQIDVKDPAFLSPIKETTYN